MSNILGQLVDEVRSVEHWTENLWHERMVQISVFAGIIFAVLSSGQVFRFVQKNIPFNLGKAGVPVLNAVVLAVVMYFGSRYLLDPLVQKISGISRQAKVTIEGYAEGPHPSFGN